MKLLLGSVICIDHFNGIDAATAYIRGHMEEISISVITRAELWNWKSGSLRTW